MNEEMNPRHHVEDDQDIRALMRESDYPGRMRDDFRRNLLRELNHNFTYHRLKTRMLVVAAILVCATAVAMRVTDVGSGGFELKPTGNVSSNGPTLQAPLTKDRLNARLGDGDLAEATAKAEASYERMKAGQMRLVRMESMTIRGKTVFFETVDILGGDEPERRMNAPGEDREFGRTLATWLKSGGAEVLARFKSGEVAPAGIDTVTYDGLVIPMSRWNWTSPELGPMVYRLWVAGSGD